MEFVVSSRWFEDPGPGCAPGTLEASTLRQGGREVEVKRSELLRYSEGHSGEHAPPH